MYLRRVYTCGDSRNDYRMSVVKSYLYGNAYDMIFGTLATFIGVLGVYLLRKVPYIAPLPYVLSNMIIVPLVLRFAYGVPDAFWFLLVTVGVGEIVCAYAGGILLHTALKRVRIFRK